MSRGFAIGCIVAGAPIAVIDAWLSMQAMFGILDPRNFLSYAVAIFGGMFFTAFIVLSEAFGKRRDWFAHIGRKFPGFAIWLTLFLVDTGTSILCAIWYGLLGYSFNTRIEISELTYKPGNWPLTSIYIAFVVVSLGCCILLGRAFETMLEKA